MPPRRAFSSSCVCAMREFSSARAAGLLPSCALTIVTLIATSAHASTLTLNIGHHRIAPRLRVTMNQGECMPTVYRVLIVLAAIVCVPALAAAQGSITGVVKDSSGAVLPGVSVEVSSPVLIERVRTAVTDGTGQYRIIDLRPGTYTVTFTLPGFNALKRDGITLSGTQVANLSVELRVGAVEETVTVSGTAPLVDVRSTQRETTLSNDTIRALPNVRSYSALLTTVPGVQTDRNN